MEKWFKYEYVCPTCDSLVTYTTTFEQNGNKDVCPICKNILALMSVVDATITPTTKKEETNMDTLTETPVQTMTLDWVNDGVTTTTTYTENDIRAMHWNNKNLNQKQNEYFRKESQLRTLLEEVYADSSDQEVLAQIADIFDVPLTKEIEVTAWIRVDMTIEVDMADGDYDIETLVSDNLTVDSYGSEINVSNHEVERVEEGAY
jgi:hypothetical protein